MFKPSLQNETLQNGVYLTYFSSVNTNQSHKNVTDYSCLSSVPHYCYCSCKGQICWYIILLN